MSQMISSLEDELSIKLLHRSRVGVKLILEGADLYPFIESSKKKLFPVYSMGSGPESIIAN